MLYKVLLIGLRKGSAFGPLLHILYIARTDWDHYCSRSMDTSTCTSTEFNCTMLVTLHVVYTGCCSRSVCQTAVVESREDAIHLVKCLPHWSLIKKPLSPWFKSTTRCTRSECASGWSLINGWPCELSLHWYIGYFDAL